MKEQSDAVAEEIEELLKKKKEAQREAIFEAYENSGRSFEEVIDFLKVTPKRISKSTGSARRERPRSVKSED